MRSRTVTANSAGTFTYSPWVMLSHYSYDYNIGFTADPQQGATGTYSVQVTEASPDYFRNIQFARTTTTLTLTCVDGDFHGLVAGDGVLIRCSGYTWDTTNGFSLEVASATSTTVFTITVLDAGPTAGVLEYAPLPVQDLTSYSAVSGRKQGTVTGAASLLRIAKVNGSLSGKVNLTVMQAGD